MRSSSFRRGAAVIVVGALAFSACSDSTKSESKKLADVAPADGAIKLKVDAVNTDSAGPDTQLSQAIQDQVVKTVQQYVNAATLTPLLTGRAGRDLAEAFTAATAARLTGNDRSALVDDGAPKTTGSLKTKQATVNLTGLADQSGNVVLVAATLGVHVNAKVEGGTLEIRRLGDFVLEPDGDAWKIADYDIGVSRSGTGVATTTSSSATATTKSKP